VAQRAPATVFLSAPPGASFSHQVESVVLDSILHFMSNPNQNTVQWDTELFGIVDGFTNYVYYNGFSVSHS
jgi:hypothetical protein